MLTEPVDILKGQSGFALVIGLIMIIVLTVIVLAASLTSVFEIKLAGNKRGSTDAFYSADSGVQVVIARVENFNLPGKYDAGNTYHYSKDPAVLADLDNMNPTRADIIIYHDSMQTKPLPGFDPDQVGFVYYLIESTGQDQVELSSIKSTSVIREKVVRLVPPP